ncbi:MAG TPA: RidA family protein [Candidatus Acidoferrales bacterium]|nr:RidA family protein [Candidatus Acidoferrales bacterium]
MAFELLNPAGLEKPVGYSHVAKITSGSLVYVAGQAPFDASGAVVGKGDFVAQFRQVMANLKKAVEGAGGKPTQFAVLTMYVTDVSAYHANKKALGAAYREVFGKYFPAITLVEVKGLYHPDCMIEISGVAVLD